MAKVGWLGGRWLVIGALGMWAVACSADDGGTNGSDTGGGAGYGPSSGGFDGNTGGSDPGTGGVATGGVGTGGIGTGGIGTGGVGTGGVGTGGVGTGGIGTGGLGTGGVGTGGDGLGGVGTGGDGLGGVGTGGDGLGGLGTGGDGLGGLGTGGDGLGGLGTGGDGLGGGAGVGVGGAGTGGDGLGGGAGAGTGGSVGDPFEPTVVPTENGNLYSLSFTNPDGDAIVFEVDANGGARIITFSINGTDVLIDGSEPLATGSTFWPAPQSQFENGSGWPPPVEIDSQPYTATVTGNVVEMVGSTNAALGVYVVKRFSANAETGIVTIEYDIVNDTGSPVSMAPWEITRVNPGGLSFYPSGDPFTWPGTMAPLPLTTSAGADWYQYSAAGVTEDSKIGADGSEGWAAHVDCGTGLERSCTGGVTPILIKQFPDIAVSEFAPDEAEQELYANPNLQYIEFEQQGAYVSIPAGGSTTYTMHWYLRSLPASITPEVGSTDLLTYVRDELY